ncbi:MAG: hypothetical protein IPG68_06825 [Micrococcales bacterium]|nr:hypothetical protein [Micrococcales bacterium]
MASRDLEEFLRWERAGGICEVLARGQGYVVVALLTCTGREEMARLRSGEPDLLAHLGCGSAEG